MSSKSLSPQIQAIGTWIDVPSESLRVFVPFGKTRLNPMGLFYFRRHFHETIKKYLRLNTISLGETPAWITLFDSRRALIVPHINR
jgi:hypothetical protein